ncbi:hypothetical protein E2C01_053393 [Portunus trituberculatus]|uniref:Uncharacterized protein n=1 Tax=Portunus trituberculatus TaxID=210409 RepID=A0A5B7GRX9_PORTR|nr:hypothetical protein [Portunus trituberculatus]
MKFLQLPPPRYTSNRQSQDGGRTAAESPECQLLLLYTVRALTPCTSTRHDSLRFAFNLFHGI